MMSEYDSERTANFSNLISIDTIKDRHIKNNSQHITIGLVNIRSFKNKDIWLKQELVEQDIDLCVVTETWLRNSDEQWIEGTELNKDGFKMQNTSRQDGRIGGGITLVYRDVYNIKKIEERHIRTFQSTKWKLTTLI